MTASLDNLEQRYVVLLARQAATTARRPAGGGRSRARVEPCEAERFADYALPVTAAIILFCTMVTLHERPQLMPSRLPYAIKRELASPDGAIMSNFPWRPNVSSRFLAQPRSHGYDINAPGDDS
jgi:hypothetical protein